MLGAKPNGRPRGHPVARLIIELSGSVNENPDTRKLRLARMLGVLQARPPVSVGAEALRERGRAALVKAEPLLAPDQPPCRWRTASSLLRHVPPGPRRPPRVNPEARFSACDAGIGAGYRQSAPGARAGIEVRGCRRASLDGTTRLSLGTATTSNAIGSRTLSGSGSGVSASPRMPTCPPSGRQVRTSNGTAGARSAAPRQASSRTPG